VPPLYFTGYIPKIYSKSILNSNSRFISPKVNSIQLSPSNLFAPNTLIKASNNSRIILEDSVWIGANSKIIAEDEDITIGSGSIIAASSNIYQSIPPMTIVGDQGKIIRTITEADKCDLPEEWNDAKRCSQSRQEALVTKEFMSLNDQERKAKEFLNL
jgi:acetyltransferase-like isoleucine patch superfamily enzyme